MANYLLDTTVCISIIRENAKVVNKVLSVGQDKCFVSEMSIAELFYGAAKSGRVEHFLDVQLIRQSFEIIPIYSSLRIYGEIKAGLERAGKRIDEFDLLIASTALKGSMTLVSHNQKHFNRLPNLRLEDWE